MTGNFQYSVLKYRHSFITGEVFNIGIIFLFDNGRIEFHYPNKLGRLTNLFHKSPSSLLKNMLSSLKGKIRSISKEIDKSPIFLNGDLSKIISKYILSENAGSLFFDEVRSGVYSKEEVNQIVNYYYKLYLGHYDEKTVSRRNEKYIIDTVKDIIKKQYSSQIENRLKVNRILHDPHGNFDEKFEYGWQNGKLNLLTPISFDLANESQYESKALRWFGTLNFLKEPARAENINFDILTTEPQDQELKKNYFKARDIIERSGAPINFYVEKEFKKYIDHAVAVVLEHDTEQE